MTLTRVMLKGSPEYSVVTDAGEVLARAHCVHAATGRFTVVMNGRFAGLGTEQQAIDTLNSLIA
jgi:hypothetical protein